MSKPEPEEECPICCFGMNEQGSADTDLEWGGLAAENVFQCANGHRFHTECFLRNIRYRARAGRHAECPSCRAVVSNAELAELGFVADLVLDTDGSPSPTEQVPSHKTVLTVAMASGVTLLCTFLAFGVVEDFVAN